MTIKSHIIPGPDIPEYLPAVMSIIATHPAESLADKMEKIKQYLTREDTSSHDRDNKENKERPG